MDEVRSAFRAMGCPCELRLYGSDRARTEAVADAARAEVLRLETKYSRYRDDSVTAAINGSAGDETGVEVDDETAGLLDYAATSFRESGGLFDITSGILRQVWDFKAGRVPTPAEVNAVLERIGWQRVHWQRPRLILPLAGMELDFGGYVKEYAVDRVSELCRRRGIRHGLVDLGGDLAVVGPHPDGSPWRIGIRHPRRPEEAISVVCLGSGAIASSGDYERGMVVDGRRYSHILDPRTGWPVSGLASVSVVAPHCLVAGTASTVAMLKGDPHGPRWLDELGVPSLRVHGDLRLSGRLPTAARGTDAPLAAAGWA
ncbi:MAG: FAD:protein FMN transferase [Proteobacteria bacterium]|nr:FAD:protein FMN transferase [Pseudomonadota bacterium]